MQKPSASLCVKTNRLQITSPKSPKSSNNLNSVVQDPDLSGSSAEKVNQKKKKKKRKRHHFEVEGDAEPVMSLAAVNNLAESAGDKKRKKKKKKRKRENEDGEKVKEKESVLSHLDTSNQEEDWCEGGIWSLTSHSDAEQPKQKPQLAATTVTDYEPKQKRQKRDSLLEVAKKKKKTKKKKHLEEDLQDTTTACSPSERCFDISLVCFCPSKKTMLFIKKIYLPL